MWRRNARTGQTETRATGARGIWTTRSPNWMVLLRLMRRTHVLPYQWMQSVDKCCPTTKPSADLGTRLLDRSQDQNATHATVQPHLSKLDPRAVQSME